MATNLDKNQTLVRWLNLVPYFRNKPNASIFEAAQDLNMDAKEVKSALDALTTTGVGSYTEEMLDLIVDYRGVNILNDQGLDKPLRLTPTEAGTFLLSLEALEAIPGLVDADAVRSAAAKLRAVLDERGVGIYDSTAEPDPVESPLQAQLADALRDGVQVVFTYWAASSDTTSHRTVSPAQIYVREGESYLIAWQEDRGAHRTFRLDRMRDLEVLDTPATPHKDELKFDAEDPFGYDRYEEAVLDIHPDATWLAEHYDIEFHIVNSDDRVVEGEFARVVDSAALDAELSGTDDDGYDPDDPDDAPIDDPLPQLTTASDGWVRATMPVASEEWMVRFCLGQADRLRVVGPQKLVDAVARAASAARDRYTQ